MSARAQSGSISWPSVAVEAFLDDDGALHVVERQVILFNGDWNGGRRYFDVGFRQRFTLDSIVRVDEAGGTGRHLLRRGHLDEVDGYIVKGSEARWRSRLPTDPPFENARITYELYYVYRDILIPGRDDNAYTLDHDFAFSDRDESIDDFELSLTLGKSWRTTGDFTGSYSYSSLLPGHGFVVTLPLTRTVSEPPRFIRMGTAAPYRWFLQALAVAGSLLFFVRLWRHDRKAGRFAPFEPLDTVTPEFLEREVYAHLPEVIGTAWDGTTSQAEVAAVIARLIQEGKLSSSVEETRIFIWKKDVLHLALEVPREKLKEHERELIDALFDPGATTTSTLAVRERYRNTGFDPASVIKDALKEQAMKVVGSGRYRGKRPNARLSIALSVTGALFLAFHVARFLDDIVTVGAFLVGAFAIWITAAISAALWSEKVHRERGGGIAIVVLCALFLSALSVFAFSNRVFRFEWDALTGFALLALGVVSSVTNQAHFAVSPRTLAAKRRLALARRWFEEQLRHEEPHFSDRAYPYLLAFGLGPQVDKWFSSFGGESRGSSFAAGSTAGHSSGFGSGGSGSQGGWAGFGGGAGAHNGFTGGGGGARFGAAIGGMAASVPSPGSSGGSGGSSSGGGSSGGGGGGGW